MQVCVALKMEEEKASFGLLQDEQHLNRKADMKNFCNNYKDIGDHNILRDVSLGKGKSEWKYWAQIM